MRIHVLRNRSRVIKIARYQKRPHVSKFTITQKRSHVNGKRIQIYLNSFVVEQ